MVFYYDAEFIRIEEMRISMRGSFALAIGALLLAGCAEPGSTSTPIQEPVPSATKSPASSPSHVLTPSPSRTATPDPNRPSTPYPTATTVPAEGSMRTATPTTTPDSEISYQRRTPFVPLDNPALLSVDEATYLSEDDLVLGLEWGGVQHAYPVRMVRFHHIVNDTISGRPFLVTY